MRLSLVLASVGASLRVAPELGTKFGPDDCVSVTRTEAGTCALQTECQGQDTTATTFAFTCATADGHYILHSYGPGGFEPVEAFDTEVKCTQCFTAPAAMDEPTDKYTKLDNGATDLIPTEKFGTAERQAKLKAATEAHVLDADKKHTGTPRKAHYFGPADCIATYRNPKTGSCVVHTSCTKHRAEFEKYDMGLTCGKVDGTSERHVFGAGAFAARETFDTLLKCDLCLGLEKFQAEHSTATTTAPSAEEPAQSPAREPAGEKADPLDELEVSVKKVSGELKSLDDRVAKLESAVQ